jgi:hypothetical protein
VYLKSQYFQRALGFERLGEIDRAIEDYGRCLTIDPQCCRKVEDLLPSSEEMLVPIPFVESVNQGEHDDRRRGE